MVPRTVAPVEQPVADSPWPAHIPVIRPGSPEFVALTDSINRLV